MKSTRALCAAIACVLLVAASGCSKIQALFSGKEEKPSTEQQKVNVMLGPGGGGTGQMSASSTLRSIASAQQAYNASHPDKGYACSLDELGLDPSIASGRGGYSFDLACEGSAPVAKYKVWAVPEANTSAKTLCADETGSIRSGDSRDNCF
jgi:hypothetical protein